MSVEPSLGTLTDSVHVDTTEPAWTREQTYVIAHPSPPGCRTPLSTQTLNSAVQRLSPERPGQQDMSQTDHSCCGAVKQVRIRRIQASKPQPWIVRKFSVGLTILIVGYSTYVYAGRFCRDMVVKSSSALGNQATGGVCFPLLIQR